MTAITTDPVTVRSMDGPFVARRCRAFGRRYRWFEQTRTAGDYLDTAGLRQLAAAVPSPDDDATAAFPRLVRPDLAIWPEVPSPALLCDVVFGDGSDAMAQERLCARLGRFLGRLHSVSADQVSALPLRRGSAWLAVASPITDEVGRARAELVRHGAADLDRAAMSAGPPTRPSCLVHGRFSSGSVVPIAVPVVLGWREAGRGDPDRDLAVFLAELVEAAAVGPAAARLDGSVRGFLGRYAETAPSRPVPRRLGALVADRLLEHCAQAVVAAGAAERAPAALAAVTTRWRGLSALLDGGAS